MTGPCCPPHAAQFLLHRQLRVAAALGLRNVTGETFSTHFQPRLINKVALWRRVLCCVFLSLIMCASWMSGFVRAAIWVSEWAQRVSPSPGHVAFCAHLRPFIPVPVNQYLWSAMFHLSLFFSCLCPSPHYPLHPPPSCPPAAQSYHTSSLFLANLSLIHYWDLFFFLESQNEEKGTDLLNFWCAAWKM